MPKVIETQPGERLYEATMLAEDAPVLINSKGKPRAVLMSLASYEARLGPITSKEYPEQAAWFCRHDLDDLAGTWTAEERAAFDAATADFEKIDESIW